MMLNFLYCFDQNYNIQALVSIYSLLENITEKINIPSTDPYGSTRLIDMCFDFSFPICTYCYLSVR